MNSKILLLFLSLLLGTNNFSQEINFDISPEDYQLFPRDLNDLASVIFSGSISDETQLKQLKLKVFKDDVLIDEKFFKIADKKFKITSKIEAGLFQYRFELYNYELNNEILIYMADNIVCGDAYIITGQSNSHASNKKSTYSSPYARSFGVKTGYETYDDKDKETRWGLATGNCKTCKGKGWEAGYDGGWFTKIPLGVGVWGMELARLLIEKHEIPVCIINGGSGSSTIEENMLYPEKISLETSFGRLAYRVDQANLKNDIKAIFYHQGESDSHKQFSLSYLKNFDILNTDWKRVYQGIDKIYLFQIHPGCGGDYQSEIREIQNEISKKYEYVEIMSTTGVVGHDGCHFSYEGYKEFASRILPLVSRDFFDEKQNSVITPPQLLKSIYSKKREITLVFDQPIKVDDFLILNEIKHFIKNQFFFTTTDNPNLLEYQVKNLSVNKNKITLKLKNEEKYNSISWIPNKEYPNTNQIYNGPWIKGKDNEIGALTFSKRELVNDL